MQMIALLRGVTPTGKNRIPRMSYLAELLTEKGFEKVQTYIQSGNILLETQLSPEETAQSIHDCILEEIGADLSVIMKTKEQLLTAIEQNPFDEAFDPSRIHLTFTNQPIEATKVISLACADFQGEVLRVGDACFYMYLPRNAEKKILSTNYLERRLGIVATTRKLSVVKRLYEM